MVSQWKTVLSILIAIIRCKIQAPRGRTKVCLNQHLQLTGLNQSLFSSVHLWWSRTVLPGACGTPQLHKGSLRKSA